MATRSRIAIRIGDKVHSVYCHWDGYPEGVGNELITRFNSRELAEGLVELGNRSWLIQPDGCIPTSALVGAPSSAELYDEPAEVVSKEQWERFSKDPIDGEQYVYEWIDDEGWIVYNVYYDEYLTVEKAIKRIQAQRY